MFIAQMEPAGLPCLLLLFTSPRTLTFPVPKVISQHHVDSCDLDDLDDLGDHGELGNDLSDDLGDDLGEELKAPMSFLAHFGDIGNNLG